MIMGIFFAYVYAPEARKGSLGPEVTGACEHLNSVLLKEQPVLTISLASVVSNFSKLLET